MLDLDGFQGHQRHVWPTTAATRCLKSFASLLKTRSRQDDLAARLGGDEFVFLLPNTRYQDADILARRLHFAITGPRGRAWLHLVDRASPNLTDEMGPDDLLKEADRNLYDAKHRLKAMQMPTSSGDLGREGESRGQAARSLF